MKLLPQGGGIDLQLFGALLVQFIGVPGGALFGPGPTVDA